MKITVNNIPKLITSSFFMPKKILSDFQTFSYLEKIQPFIFGRDSYEAAKKLEIDPYDLVFINEQPFSFYYNKYRKYFRSGEDNLKAALLLRKLYKGEFVRISQIGWTEHICVTDPGFMSLSIIDMESDNTKLNQIIQKKAEKNEQKNLPLNEKAEHVLETARLAAIRYNMKKAINSKELIDKYNFRRFSTNLMLYNRPANLTDINNVLARRKMFTFADLSETMTRLNFSALYAMTYGKFSINDIYGGDTPFDENSKETDRQLAYLSSQFIEIIYNNNSVEVTDVLTSMIKKLASLEIPKVNASDFENLIENYNIYFAIASLAGICENIFMVNADLKRNLRNCMADSEWSVPKKIALMKKFSAIIRLCHVIAGLNIEAYRDIASYQNDVYEAFEIAVKAQKELNGENAL